MSAPDFEAAERLAKECVAMLPHDPDWNGYDADHFNLAIAYLALRAGGAAEAEREAIARLVRRTVLLKRTAETWDEWLVRYRDTITELIRARTPRG